MLDSCISNCSCFVATSSAGWGFDPFRYSRMAMAERRRSPTIPRTMPAMAPAPSPPDGDGSYLSGFPVALGSWVAAALAIEAEAPLVSATTVVVVKIIDVSEVEVVESVVVAELLLLELVLVGEVLAFSISTGEVLYSSPDSSHIVK